MTSLQKNLVPWIKEKTWGLAAGGNWIHATSAGIQRNLRWFLMDGVTASILEGAFAPFLSIYLLALGATNSQIGLMASLAGLSGTAALLPGAWLAERSGKRKLIFILCGGGAARFTIFLSALTPLLVAAPTAVALIIAMKILADGLGNFSGPAWTSLAGDIVPLAWRGRYFGARSLLMSVSAMAATFLAGRLITQFGGSVKGYQIAFALGALAGAISTWMYAHIQEPASPASKPSQQPVSVRSTLQSIISDRSFRNYLAFLGAWSLAVGIGGPYFVLYLVQGLKAAPGDVALFSIAGALAGLPAVRLFGHLSDRWGNRKIQLITGFLLPIWPFAWIITRQPVHGIWINIPAGFLWAGFTLVTFNYMLTLAPSEKMARYAAICQFTGAIASATGTFIGSLIVARWGFIPIFVLTGFGRFASILFFSLTKPGQPADQSAPILLEQVEI